MFFAIPFPFFLCHQIQATVNGIRATYSCKIIFHIADGNTMNRTIVIPCSTCQRGMLVLHSIFLSEHSKTLHPCECPAPQLISYSQEVEPEPERSLCARLPTLIVCSPAAHQLMQAVCGMWRVLPTPEQNCAAHVLLILILLITTVQHTSSEFSHRSFCLISGN